MKPFIVSPLYTKNVAEEAFRLAVAGKAAVGLIERGKAAARAALYNAGAERMRRTILRELRAEALHSTEAAGILLAIEIVKNKP